MIPPGKERRLGGRRWWAMGDAGGLSRVAGEKAR